MKTFALAAQPRVELGKKATKALREKGLIPVVLNGGEIVDLPYAGTLKPGEKVVEIGNGKGLVTTDLYVTNEAVRKLVYTPEIFAIELYINDEKVLPDYSGTCIPSLPSSKDIKPRMAILKEIQFHPVKDNILHIDLLEVSDKKPVVVEVPVKLEGHAEGVKAGGKLSLSMKKLKVKAIYTDIPERLLINVDNLGLGKALQVGDIHFDKLEMMNAKNAVVCAVQLTRAARGAAAAAAAGK